MRAAWGFGVETGTHAIRLILGGVFDRHPTLQLMLGHLGETLPFAVWRLDHRVSMRPHGRTLQRSVTEYLRENVHGRPPSGSTARPSTTGCTPRSAARTPCACCASAADGWRLLAAARRAYGCRSDRIGWRLP